MAMMPPIVRTKQLRSYYDFRGGLNTDAALDNMLDNELVRADNVDLLERGGIVKRKGYVRLNEEHYGFQVEQIIEWPRDSGESWLLAIVGPNLCRIREDQSYQAEILAPVASDKIGHFFLQDKFYFVDGQSYRVYDGSTVENVEPYDDETNDLEPIKRCRFVVRHPNSYRIFAAGDSQNPKAWYFSEPNDPTYFKETNVLHPTTGDGPVQGLAVFGDALVVFYRHSLWVWRGTDPETDAVWHKVPSGVGTMAPWSVDLTPNSMTFLGEGGLYAISPAILGFDVTIEPTEGMVLNLAKNKVEKLIREIRDPSRATGIFDAKNQRYRLACTDAEGVRNNQILVFDWNLGAFTRYTGIAVNHFLYRLNGDLLAATNGFIIKMGVGYRDHDQPIPMDVLTKAYNLDFPFHKKRLLRLYCSFRQPDQETSKITLRLYVDDILRAEILEEGLYENFVWGKSIWGEAIWGFRNTITTRTRIYGSGHRVQVQFFNDQLDDPTTVYGIAFEFRPSRAKGRLL